MATASLMQANYIGHGDCRRNPQKWGGQSCGTGPGVFSPLSGSMTAWCLIRRLQYLPRPLTEQIHEESPVGPLQDCCVLRGVCGGPQCARSRYRWRCKGSQRFPWLRAQAPARKGLPACGPIERPLGRPLIPFLPQCVAPFSDLYDPVVPTPSGSFGLSVPPRDIPPLVPHVRPSHSSHSREPFPSPRLNLNPCRVCVRWAETAAVFATTDGTNARIGMARDPVNAFDFRQDPRARTTSQASTSLGGW
jgi:hypothetical protein